MDLTWGNIAVVSMKGAWNLKALLTRLVGLYLGSLTGTDTGAAMICSLSVSCCCFSPVWSSLILSFPILTCLVTITQLLPFHLFCFPSISTCSRPLTHLHCSKMISHYIKPLYLVSILFCLLSAVLRISYCHLFLNLGIFLDFLLLFVLLVNEVCLLPGSS